MRALSLLVVVATAAGCVPYTGPLVDHDAWATADVDPLSDHRPDAVDCPDTEWRVEDDALEVETEACNYLALSQPSLGAVPEGADVHLVMWFSTLDAAEPAEAHAAILFGDAVAWEITVPIPSPPDVYDVDIPAPAALAEGDPIGVHLHNHGDNAWTFFRIEVRD